MGSWITFVASYTYKTVAAVCGSGICLDWYSGNVIHDSL